jgi:L-asparaginase II
VANDTLIGQAGDPQLVTYWRSCAKPFQLLPFLQSGQLDELGWGADEIALSVASHGGEPEHVAIAERMLQDIGLEEGDLACGVQEPLSTRGARILHESGARPTRLHNSCSGKHAAMLARAHMAGWHTQGYERADHPVHQSIFRVLEQWTDLPVDAMAPAIDGCGVVVYALPLEVMSRAFARFAVAANQGDAAPKRVIDAVRSCPFLVAGSDRFDSVLIEETNGAVISKVGAEGIQCAMIVDQGIGIALKVEDGSRRAQAPALLLLLQQLGVLPDPLPPRLADLARKPVWNTRHEVVGDVAAVAALSAMK